MLQLSDGIDVWVIDVRGKDYYNKLKPILENILILGQNLKFDYKFLKLEGTELDNIYDTFLAECALTNGIKERSLGLGSISKKYVNKSLDKSIRNQFIGLEGKPFTYKQIIYGAEDVLYLHRIRELQLQEANKLDLIDYILLECQACLALADIEYNGLGFDSDQWLKLAKEVNERIPELEKELDNFVLSNSTLKSFINNTPQLDIFGGIGRKVKTEWSSPTQVLKLIRVLVNDPKLLSTEEKEIGKYQKDYPLIKRFIDYKKEAKLSSTYGNDFIKWINPITKRIHSDFWQILVTSRISSNNPNLQNLPRSNSYLNCFIASKGYQIIGIDYKGQEARIAACFSKEESWINAIKEGKDLHSEVAKLMFNISDELVRTYPDFLRGSSYRDIAKNINFMALFGGTKWKLSKMLLCSLEEADKLLQAYFSTTRNLQIYLNKCAAYGLKRGYIRSAKPYSAIRWFDNWREDLDTYRDSKIIGEITRNCYNSPEVYGR